MLTDQERQVEGPRQVEVRIEQTTQIIEGGDRLFLVEITAEPIGRGRVFIQPGAGGGDDELSTLVQQAGQGVETMARLAQSIEEIGQEDDVEPTEAGPGRLGIAWLERDAVAIDVGGDRGGGGEADLAFLGVEERERSVVLELSGHFDEPQRMIHPDHLDAMPGQFERGSTDGATEVKGARGGGKPVGIEARGNATDRIIERLDGSERPGENLARGAVMEQEVFGQGAIGFVKSGWFHALKARWRWGAGR